MSCRQGLIRESHEALALMAECESRAEAELLFRLCGLKCYTAHDQMTVISGPGGWDSLYLGFEYVWYRDGGTWRSAPYRSVKEVLCGLGR